jgi:hypothetical protein
MITDKITKQSALIANKNAQSHSNPIKTDQFTVENATQKEDHPEDTNQQETSFY